MRFVSITVLAVCTVLLLFSATGCSNPETPQSADSYPFPAEPPDIPMPELPVELMLSSQLNIIDGQKIGYTENIENLHFYNCEISIKGKDITVKNCEFLNSIIYLENSEDILFEGNIVRDLNRYEKTALIISNSINITVTGCWFEANYIGLGINGSSVSVLENRFLNNNGHNALAIGDGSSAGVSGNYFYGSFPHAILIMNRDASPQTTVDIHHNIIDQTGEDAINFEDYRGASPSRVYANIITNTGWAAINVEYNSWEANITIEANWIEGTGIDWELPLHPLNPEQFQQGWGHGILVEDSSLVTILNNRIIKAGENGIEITNGRDITVTDNGISCSGAGIGLHAYNESSLQREFSPLKSENAGSSHATVDNNVIFEAREDYEIDELSEMSIPD